MNENERVLASKESILDQDFKRLEELITKSHQSLKIDYEISCEKLDFLVERAVNHSGCAGARLIGGGFGGYTLNLGQKGNVPDFIKVVEERHRERFSMEAHSYEFDLVNGTNVWRIKDE